MAKFCSEYCKQRGGICDFCIHYKDKYRDILKNEKFSGDGLCDVDDSKTDATLGYNCDNFECFKNEQTRGRIIEKQKEILKELGGI